MRVEREPFEMRILIPAPALDVIPTEVKEGSTNQPQYAATLRSFTGPIQYVDRSGETITTEATGNRNPHHDVRLSREQYAEWTRVMTVLTGEPSDERTALVAAIAEAGGIDLPNGGGGRAAKRGETLDLAALLAVPEAPKGKGKD